MFREYSKKIISGNQFDLVSVIFKLQINNKKEKKKNTNKNIF